MTRLFLVGLATGLLLPRIWKPALRQTVKGTMLLTDEVRQIADQVREDIEDISAEAAASHRPTREEQSES